MIASGLVTRRAGSSEALPAWMDDHEAHADDASPR